MRYELSFISHISSFISHRSYLIVHISSFISHRSYLISFLHKSPGLEFSMNYLKMARHHELFAEKHNTYSIKVERASDARMLLDSLEGLRSSPGSNRYRRARPPNFRGGKAGKLRNIGAWGLCDGYHRETRDQGF